eukprot:COSAG02_NODE_9514_length_2190_cov_18.311490_3_plen_309_part_01
MCSVVHSLAARASQRELRYTRTSTRRRSELPRASSRCVSVVGCSQALAMRLARRTAFALRNGLRVFLPTLPVEGSSRVASCSRPANAVYMYGYYRLYVPTPAVCFSGAAIVAAAGCCTVAACNEKRTVLSNIDLTGDGVRETTAYDTVGDGKVDSLDTSGDGQVDTVLVDLYRDTPLRYMGYSNEVGEAFRPIVPRLVVPSYALAIVYVLADTADKARKAHDLSVAVSGAADTRQVLEQAGDCLVWQLLASVFVPGAVIHQVVHFLGRAIKSVPTLPPLSTRCQPECSQAQQTLFSGCVTCQSISCFTR